MIDALKRHWHGLAKERPGHRFQNHYRRAHMGGHRRNRVLRLSAGIALVVVGLILLVIPGPGTVFVILGGALLAEESSTIARLLDTAEVQLRRFVQLALRTWRQTSTAGKCSAALMSLALFGTALWLIGKTLMGS
jgi:hypothetical protein